MPIRSDIAWLLALLVTVALGAWGLRDPTVQREVDNVTGHPTRQPARDAKPGAIASSHIDASSNTIFKPGLIAAFEQDALHRGFVRFYVSNPREVYGILELNGRDFRLEIDRKSPTSKTIHTGKWRIVGRRIVLDATNGDSMKLSVVADGIWTLKWQPESPDQTPCIFTEEWE